MCRVCEDGGGLSRRQLCQGLLAAPLVMGAVHKDGLVEPILRLQPQAGPRRVAVTLDACPGHFDPRIANFLVDRKIPATIFITAVWMRMNPEGLAFFLKHPDVFTLENHGARHLPPVLGAQRIYGLEVAGSWSAIEAEIAGGAAAIYEVTGRHPAWYRGAAGLYTPSVVPRIEAMGVRVAGYSLNSDAGASLPAALVEARIKAARDGDVMEGHINQPKRASGAGIAAGLAALKGAGVQFAKLDDAA
ncbi:polysaccharide deacetylase family protein [Acidocella aminolytica]|uniref:Chitooligosaccharide deacetylase n=2 Tax=Acidocella TaxID=50709 RepID=A0A0D6PJV6_9PROT|nr:polysaccharide deacetylase family protein [Acidocella aminolytica]GAN81069.1 polysaccharide deacetylase [Acidocella aminolytica 101 = DSM 11237]GBQ41530.1 putative xylanase [Acidocella aminolytica 101 = DSM 11237]SHF12782.1 Peptidoglycan/xylan/chitin deacetylase, PgdA/CDA1 family [Acidocella aminolytica 101 = DSM 11237]